MLPSSCSFEPESLSAELNITVLTCYYCKRVKSSLDNVRELSVQVAKERTNFHLISQYHIRLFHLIEAPTFQLLPFIALKHT